MSTPEPAWTPPAAVIEAANATRWMRGLGLATFAELHRWSVDHREQFWQRAIAELGIVLATPYSTVVDLSDGAGAPRWLPGAAMNIAASCFAAPDDSPAIVFAADDGTPSVWSVSELRAMTGRVANGLRRAGFGPGEALAIDMPMTARSVAIYLGIVAAGCVAVSIADSFAPHEIATRLRIARAKGIFTQDVIIRGAKTLALYQKVRDADAPRAIVVVAGETSHGDLRNGDLFFEDFLVEDDTLEPLARAPADTTNVLFSSGTTGDPKAIPWTHTTPIKAAADGHLHHDIHPGDVVCWPTNLGWMMGPWLIYATLLGRATIALWEGVPTGAEFCRFVARAKVTMLGVVPSLVRAWRTAGATDNVDWTTIRAFSSTGEVSNADDMRWLMAQAGGKPVIEYCGGTEIGGGYLTGSVVQPAVPGMFTTPALGLELCILDESGQPSDSGEVFLVPPSMGLSNELLNRDHHEVYYEGTPPGPGGKLLRRHGDEVERLPGGYFKAHGRVDDTMNLGGIKTSSAELERVMNADANVLETAAIAAAPPGGGPSLLVVYVVLETDVDIIPTELHRRLQQAIKQDLNPLFKIHEIVITEALPRTASNKVMRRSLRSEYMSR